VLLISGGTVVTMDASGNVISGGAVLIDGDRIRAVGRREELAVTPGIARVIVADDHMVLPGLVNAHNHCFQTLYRGLGRDRALVDWSTQVIYPLSRWLTAPDAEAATRLACLEMLLSGITTFVDSHYIHVDRETFDGVARAALASGMRAVLGRAAMDAPVVPEPFREEPDVARRAVDRAIARWHGAGQGRIRVRPEALSERTSTPTMIATMVAAARAAGTGFNTHLGESQ
jgi:5-methylthioadenosine/S-adenosylhomocysteine deaminase